MGLPRLQPTGGTPTTSDFVRMQTTWKSLLDPLLANPANSANILTGIVLKDGVTVINHGLGRTPQGWIITDIDGAATVYRSAPLNSLTLSLTSSAKVTVSIEVF